MFRVIFLHVNENLNKEFYFKNLIVMWIKSLKIFLLFPRAREILPFYRPYFLDTWYPRDIQSIFSGLLRFLDSQPFRFSAKDRSVFRS